MIAELIESLSDRTNDDNDTDMSLMTRDDDNSIDWENKLFEPTAKLKSKGGPIEEYAERGASRLYEELTATRDGQLADVRTSWIDVGAGVGYDPEGLYFFEVGPTVATAPGVTWNAAFTMDLDDAPAFKSDAWKDMAREFQLSEHEAEHGTESMIMCAYSALEELTERNDGDRAVHPRELRQHGPAVTDRYFDLAMTCLAEFDGVDGPTEGPAWSYADPERVDTEAGDTEETPA